jgi:uracil-DNA glycosylase
LIRQAVSTEFYHRGAFFHTQFYRFVNMKKNSFLLEPPHQIEALHQEVIDCQRCPRLRNHCTNISAIKRRSFMDWDYWGKPVPGFGDPRARILILGLAPAAHGANRTGRMFTGDRSGDRVRFPARQRFVQRRPDADRCLHHSRRALRSA